MSRVLNGGPNVRAEVRERVLNAVEALGYKVNAQARVLAGGATRQLTLVHESVLDAEPNSYYHSALELGALRSCAQCGFTLSMLGLDPADGDAGRRLLEMIHGGQADGVMLTPPFSDDASLVRLLIGAGRPVVCISGGAGIRNLTAAVGMDDEAAGLALGRYIIGLGHRRLGYINGTEGHMSAACRLTGLRRAAAEGGEEVSIFEAQGDFTFRAGIQMADKLFSTHGDITALVCANDDMAAGALLTAHRRGLSIPAQVSISGFDDTPVSEIVWPPLTTVHQPIRMLGQRAAELVVDAIQGGRSATGPGFEAVPFRIVERASTGPAPL